ncbi:baseplate J/gp47 family protein [Escherichia coli]|nr:baseplate J/gp47 family protein [Escherichia coli]
MSGTTIDLSLLPPPDAIEEPEFETLLDAMRETIIAQFPDTQQDAVRRTLALDSAMLTIIAQAFTYREMLWRTRVNEAVYAVLLSEAENSDLDQIGANFQVERLLITPADETTIPPTEAVYEDDDAFRERIQLSWARLSTAGARNAYHYFAKSADPDVLDVKAYGPETHSQEGRIYLYVLSRTGDGTAPQSLLDQVAASVNDDEIRPLTDFVSVRSAEIVPYDVVAEIHTPYGVDTAVVTENAREALKTYTDKVHRIGQIAACSGIDAALHRPGVVTVRLISPTGDIIPAMGQAPWCRSIRLTRTEFTDE